MACRGARLPTLGPCAGQSRPNAEGIFGESEDSAPECTSRPATPPHRCTRLPGGRGPPPATARVPSSQDATTVGSRAHVAAARETLGEKPGLFTPAEVSFVRSHANRINDLRLDKKVPCHGDYTSQNWLVDAFDTLRVSTSEHRGGPSRPPTSRSCSSARGGGVPTWRLCSSRATAVRSRSTSWSSSDCAWATYAVQGIVFGHERGTHQHQDYGRARLADLMKGHQVHHRSPPSSSRTRP